MKRVMLGVLLLILCLGACGKKPVEPVPVEDVDGQGKYSVERVDMQSMFIPSKADRRNLTVDTLRTEDGILFGAVQGTPSKKRPDAKVTQMIAGVDVGSGSIVKRYALQEAIHVVDFTFYQGILYLVGVSGPAEDGIYTYQVIRYDTNEVLHEGHCFHYEDHCPRLVVIEDRLHFMAESLETTVMPYDTYYCAHIVYDGTDLAVLDQERYIIQQKNMYTSFRYLSAYTVDTVHERLIYSVRQEENDTLYVVTADQTYRMPLQGKYQTSVSWQAGILGQKWNFGSAQRFLFSLPDQTLRPARETDHTMDLGNAMAAGSNASLHMLKDSKTSELRFYVQQYRDGTIQRYPLTLDKTYKKSAVNCVPLGEQRFLLVIGTQNQFVVTLTDG